MRIPCPYCGARDAAEFVCRGEAPPPRPTEDSQFHDYVYLRDNPAGPLEELWYHALGCRSWILVRRDTLTHVIESARLAGHPTP